MPTADDGVALAGLPATVWIGRPASFGVSEDAAGLSITAGPRTDWFHDPVSGRRTDTAAALTIEPSGDFTLSARVAVTFRDTFDAGVLCLYRDADTWAKLCLEYSPDGEATIVSVVTREFSDDTTATAIDGSEVFFRVLRTGDAYAFHYSTDGRRWRFARVFRLGAMGGVRAGFLAQSPRGEGCTAAFSDIRLGNAVPADLRDGT